MSKDSGPPQKGKSDKKRPGRAPALPPMETRHKVLLGVVGVVIAALLVLGLEAGLRLGGYGPDLRVFKPVEILGEKYLEANRDVSLRFFPADMVKEAGIARFPAQKSPDTYRIFSLGESATLGDPWGPQGSFSSFLQEMLHDVHPDRKFEILNCGIVAISSADVLDLVPEILRQKPDAILIYVGNNEAYGADAVLSGFRSTLTNRNWIKLRIWSRRTRVGMLLGNLLHHTPAAGVPSKGFGMDVVEGKVISHESKLHRQMLEIYRGNLQEMCDRARAAGVDVILCTTAANLRDQSPLGSGHSPSLSEQRLNEWQDDFSKGKAAMDAGHPDEAIPFLQKAVEIDSCYAEARFRLARCLDPRGKNIASPDPATLEKMRREYQAACNEDIVHFRSCSDQAQVVREVAARNQSPHLVLVDLAREAAAAAPDGIIGHEFMTEHVHPYMEGHAFLADRICRAMAASPVGSKLGSWDLSRLRPTAEYMSRLGLGDGERATGLIVTVQGKLAKWPFVNAYENPQAVSYIEGQIREGWKSLNPIEASVIADFRDRRFPDGFDYGRRHSEIARRAQVAGNNDLALHELRLCEKFWGPLAVLDASMALSEFQKHDLAPMDSLLDVAQKLDPKLAKVRYLRGMLRRAQGRLPEARSEFEACLKIESTGVIADAARLAESQMGR